MLLANLGIFAAVYLSKQLLDHIQSTDNVNNSFKSAKKTDKKLEDQLHKDNIDIPVSTNHLHYTATSGVSVAMASAGYLFAPPLSLLSIAVISYNTTPVLNRALHTLRTERKITNDSYSAFVPILLLGVNNPFAAGMQNMLYHLSNHLIAKNKADETCLATNAYHQAPERVWILVGEIEQQIPLIQVNIGDAVIVTTGETIPVDGMITTGNALVDQQALTGEANPIEKSVGDTVMAATIVLSGRIIIEAIHSGEETRIDKLNILLHQTRDYKTQLQLKGEAWADKASLPLMLTCAGLAPFISINSALALLFSAPVNTIRAMLSLQTSAHMQWITQQGALIKDGRVLEELPNIDTILFDKTGTLTQTHPEVVAIIPCAERDADTLLALAAAAEQRQEHPVAKAIIDKAKAENIPLPEVTRSNYDLGMGVTVTIDHHEVKVGSLRFIQQATQQDLPTDIETAMQKAIGHTFILIAVDDSIQGALELHPRLRPEVPLLISQLRQRGLKQLSIVSGDQQAPTDRLAQQLAMDNAYGNVLPEDKAGLIKHLQQQGHRVCFIGDGLNDAIAMKQANVSICLSSATALTSEVAQIVMQKDSLAPVNSLFDMAEHLHQGLNSHMKMWIGFGVANALAVPLLGFGPIQSSLLYGVAFSMGVKVSKDTPQKTAVKTQYPHKSQALSSLNSSS